MPTVDPLHVQGEAFYVVIGRPDLAEQYRSRQLAKTATRVVGGVALTVGVLALLVEMAATLVLVVPSAIACQMPSDDCLQDRSNPVAPVGILLGTALLIAPSFVPTDPLRPEEKYRLVHGPRAAGSPAAGNAAVAISLSGAPLLGGGQLQVTARF